MTKNVFISYRRDDTASAAGRIYDRLISVSSKKNVFFDVNNIGGGEDFEKRIRAEIERSEVALVFVGDKWMGLSAETGKTRLSEPDDHVRAEVRAILARNIFALPILVSGARVPKPDQLPDDVRAISSLNALPLRHESFDRDTETIIETALGVSLRALTSDRRRRRWATILYAVVGTVLASVFLVVAALLHFWILHRPVAASIGAPVTALLGIAAIGGGCWIGASWASRRRRVS